MHEFHMGSSLGHHGRSYLVFRIEDSHPLLLGQLCVVQAVPYIGIYKISVLKRFIFIISNQEGSAAYLAVCLCDCPVVFI